MRFNPAVAATVIGLLLLAMPAPLVGAAGTPGLFSVTVHDAAGTALTNSSQAVASAELLGNTSWVNITAALSGSADSAQLVVVLQCLTAPCHTLERSMVRNATNANNWTAKLELDDSKLIAGDYNLEVRVFNGSEVAQYTSGKRLHLTANDQTAPTLELSGGGNVTRIGPSGVIRVTATDALLWKVTHQIQGLAAESALAPPYVLSASGLIEGTTFMTFRAYDRAGQVTALPVTVIRDVTPPTLTATLPNATYRGLPFSVVVSAVDASSTTIALQGNGTQGATYANGTGQSTFTIVPATIGNLSFVATATDAVGNQATVYLQTQVFQQFTNVTLISLLTQDSGRIVVGEAVEVSAIVRQTEGVAPVQIDLLLANVTVGNSTVNVGQTSTVLYTTNVSIGVYQLNFSVRGPAGVPELNATDQALNITFEVFLGRVITDSGSYYIRNDGQNLPSQAIALNGDNYTLQLEERGNSIVYIFNVSGASYYWDPAQPTTDLRTQQTSSSSSSSSSSTAPEANTPAPPAALLLAMLVALAYAARRRL